MATGFLALLDDIAAMMDDVAMMSKVAGKKTAGILGDDLAVNAEKSSGFASSRELPVLWAIAKGSLINKLIILPAAFALSSILPEAIHVILILGGLFLAYEGAEKVFEYFIPLANAHDEDKEVVSSESDILAIEKTKIKSAILTDFILSVEIVIIAMGTVLDKPILIQIIVVSIIALIASFTSVVCKILLSSHAFSIIDLKFSFIILLNFFEYANLITKYKQKRLFLNLYGPSKR